MLSKRFLFFFFIRTSTPYKKSRFNRCSPARNAYTYYEKWLQQYIPVRSRRRARCGTSASAAVTQLTSWKARRVPAALARRPRPKNGRVRSGGEVRGGQPESVNKYINMNTCTFGVVYTAVYTYSFKASTKAWITHARGAHASPLELKLFFTNSVVFKYLQSHFFFSTIKIQNHFFINGACVGNKTFCVLSCGYFNGLFSI